MNNIKTLKRTIFFIFCLYISLSISKFSYAEEDTNSCKNVNGKFYITDEYSKKCGYLGCSAEVLATITSYETVAECSNAAIQKYGCIPAVENKVFYGTQEQSNYRVNFSTNNISLDDAKACLLDLAKNPLSTENVLGGRNYCSSNIKFFQCKCTTNLIGSIGVAGQIVSWATGSQTYNCYLSPLTVPNLVKRQPVLIQSPLTLVKVTADTLFFFAIFLFSINFLRVGYIYVRSDGLPDQLKKARNLLFNTISGMIFFILVSGLLIFVNNGFGF